MSMDELRSHAEEVINAFGEYKYLRNNCHTFVERLLEKVGKKQRQTKLSTAKITAYVNEFGTTDPSVAVNKIKHEENAQIPIDREVGAKSISIDSVLEEYPIDKK